jgi:acyl transferase domain-containing protein/threonine dehydrogenase-like Zn-dependent dehydrogenase/acyl carrier protein
MSERADRVPISALKLALMAREARAQSQSLLNADPIAIIGMACRLPGGADSPAQLWQLLCDGTDAVGPVPHERWDADAWTDSDPAAPGKTLTRQGGFLRQIDAFDAGYFGILPREAERMDPQQRLLLEVAIEAFDDAGLPRERLARSRTGVYAASYHNDYAQLQYADPDAIDLRTLTGTLHSVLANRLSFLLDLRGPSLSIDTACSSGLVAMHLACQSLRSGETDVALAAGVSLMITPELLVAMSKVGFMSPDGRCKTFDASADGFGRGEGCGALVLKRLSDAVADGDRVHAVVRATAVNQDGHSTVLAAPSGPAQEALLRDALAQAQIEPSRVGFIETHGTGTALGDPIEVEAIAAVLGKPSPHADRCHLGSLKANIGHLEAAAGVAGLIKTVLALQHEAIPPQPHFSTLNPHLSLAGTRLAIPTALTPWPRGAQPRVAGASSFGVGGTNAHVIVEEAPRLRPDAGPVTKAEERMLLLPLSAQDDGALRALATHWIDFLQHTPASTADLAYTASQRRSHLDRRLAVAGRSKAEWRARLQEWIAGSSAAATRRAGAPRVGFVFSGQGPQWSEMGRELHGSEPAFRDAFDAVDALLRPLAGWTLRDEWSVVDTRHSRLAQTEFAQPALFALQVALAALWRSWGVVPAGIVGHSVGEIAALHVAGVLSLADAVHVVWQRGRAMQRAAGTGHMAAVPLSASDAFIALQPWRDTLSVAAVNAPSSVVLAGETAALDAASAALTARGVAVQRLPMPYAFHSAQMSPCADRLAEALHGVAGGSPSVAFYSTVTGARTPSGHAFDASYFGRNVQQPVLFAPAIEAMADDDVDVFLEIGPHPVLTASVADTLADKAGGFTSLPTLRRGKPEREMLLQAAAATYAAGAELEWDALQGVEGDVVSLPPYPWQRQRHWIRQRPAGRVSRPDAAVHALLGTRLPLAAIEPAVFEGGISSWTGPTEWLADHRIFDRLLMPAAALIEVMASAALQMFGSEAVTLEDFAIERPLALPEDRSAAPARWQTTVRRHGASHGHIELHTSDGSGWQRVASATAKSAADDAPAAQPAPSSASFRAVDHETFYDAYAALGVAFGPRLRTLRDLTVGDDRAAATTTTHEPPTGPWAHAAQIDAALQLCSAAAPAGAQGQRPARVMLPVAAQSITLRRCAPAPLRAEARVTRGDDRLDADLWLRTDDGSEVVSMRGVRFVRADAAAPPSMHNRDRDVYVEVWERAAATPACEATPAPRGLWLLVADHSGTAAALASELTTAGHRCVCVHLDASSETKPSMCDVLNSDDPESFDRWFAEVHARHGQPRGIVHLTALDAPADSAVGRPSVLRSALHLAQALGRAPFAAPPSIHFVTRGAVAASATTVRLNPIAAGLWGLASVIAAEHVDWAVHRIDLDPAESAPAHGTLLSELNSSHGAGASDGPRLVALRGNARHTPRLRALGESASALSDAVQLTVAPAASARRTALQPLLRKPLAANELRLQVLAAGLNFRDLMLSLGLYLDGAMPLGAECAGRVIEVGACVNPERLGQLVHGYAPASLASEVVVREDFVAPVPPGLDVIQAAALPVAMLTAMHGLDRLAALQRGERVLIHAAAGGVGLAAVQLALRRGAIVHGSAGTPAKRDMLQRLGVAHVHDSRSLAFADEVLALTGSAGVQVVLNSLAGEFIPAGLRALGRGGRFLELGKRDILSRDAVAELRPDVSYHPYDLGAEAQVDPGLLPPMFDTLRRELAQGVLRPLPTQTYAFADADDALHQMAQARHVGKLVLVPPPQRRTRALQIDADASYWITGGLGGLGLATARWLVDSGARHLVLTGRHAAGDGAQAAINTLSRAGAQVEVELADSADRIRMAKIFHAFGRARPPLRGIVHAAGTLHDGVLARQRWDPAADVLRGKADGAWVLHELTQAMVGARALDFFILYSAAGARLGAAGQGLYAAANAELDALAQRRHALGLPALAVAWGLWTGTGMAAGPLGTRDPWQERGLLPITAETGFVHLRTLLESGAPHGLVLPIDWARFLAKAPGGVDADYFAAVRRAAADAAHHATPASQSAASLLQRLRATPGPQRQTALRDALVQETLAVLGLPAGSALDARVPLKDMGLDSLMAVELRNALARAFGEALPVTLLFDHPTLQALAQHLSQRFALIDVAATPAGAPSSGGAAHADVQSLSDADAEALLLAELNGGASATR